MTPPSRPCMLPPAMLGDDRPTDPDPEPPLHVPDRVAAVASEERAAPPVPCAVARMRGGA